MNIFELYLNELNTSKSIVFDVWMKVGAGDISFKANNGNDIFNWLISDARMLYNMDDKIISGDKNIWYLCLGERQGDIIYNTKKIYWKSGQASPLKMYSLIQTMYNDKVFNSDQYRKLIDNINICKKLKTYDNMVKYLMKG